MLHQGVAVVQGRLGVGGRKPERVNFRRGDLMSLKDLTRLRVSGKVPSAVWVVVGDRPRMSLEGPDLVYIAPNEDVRRMDFRPLVGLHVDVFENGDYPELFNATARAIDAAKPKSTGLATRHRADGINDKHEALLRRTWEMLCN